MSWSGGKDGAVALFELRRGGGHDVRGLVTTIGQDDGRIAYHGVPAALVQAQADALGLPLHLVPLPTAASNVQYEAAMRDALSHQIAAGAGARAIAFGDLFLEDIRRYREALTARIGLEPIFPVWGRDTTRFADAFVDSGFRAIVVSVDLARLDASFAGRPFDAAFVTDLPVGVDPCGENGEFHSFVFDGPGFAAPIAVRAGDRTERAGYCYCDLSSSGA